MVESVEALVTQFERGEIARREFVAGLLAVAVGRRSEGRTGLVAARDLGHVNIRVRDVPATERFYRELLGLPASRPVVGGAFALDLPTGAFISLCPLTEPDCGMKQGGPNGEIDHFAVGIDDFREGATAGALKARGLEINDAGESVFVKDPNGTWVQLSAPRYKG
jgi:catechol 2,3-dioxygenase-like lactoylglutathione lyase family enzyme